MPMPQRILIVTLSMPGGDVVLRENIQMDISVSKAALAIQSRASVTLYGLSTTLRQQLLSQFTAWNKRRIETGGSLIINGQTVTNPNFINIKIEAGYGIVRPNFGSSVFAYSLQTALIFVGQVVLVDPVSEPPNIGVRLTCYTRQIDKTKFVTEPAPEAPTFQQYVEWAARQMGFITDTANNLTFDCSPDIANRPLQNPSRSTYVAAALLIDIQNTFRPDVAAFVDNDQLIVKDKNKIINIGAISVVKSFVGTPIWTEWGVTWTTLMDSTLKLAQGATITSSMNPGVNGTYVITELEYQLSSRSNNFYSKASGSPPA